MDKKDVSVVDELRKYNLPDDVVSEGARIWKSMNAKIKEKRKTAKLYFFLIFTAYCNLGFPIPPEEVAEIVKISKSDYKKSYNTYSPFDTGLPINNTIFYPKHYLPGFCKKANFTERMTNNMIAFSENIIRLHPDLMENSPATLSTGIFKYYAFCQGYEFKPEEIKAITGISKGTSDDYYKLIMSLDNS